MKTNTLKARKQSKKQEYLDSIAGAPVHGEIVAWGAKGPHSHATVVAALKEANLDDKIARELLPRFAFSRACKQLSDDRLIDLFKEEKDNLYFQFTKKFFENEGIDYKKETMLVLNKTTGQVSCVDATIQEIAQKTLDRCTEQRTTSDITRIVQKLFDQHSDLIPIRDHGGAYFVPKLYTEFTVQVGAFLGRLGGTINRWPIAAGTAQGDKTVQESVLGYMTTIADEHKTAIAGFGVDTRKDVLENTAEKIKSTRLKLEAYALWLGDQKDDLLKQLDESNEALLKQIDVVAEYKEEKKTERIATPYVPQGKDAYGNRNGTAAAKINVAVTSKPKTFDEIATEAGVTSNRVKFHLRWLIKHKASPFVLTKTHAYLNGTH